MTEAQLENGRWGKQEEQPTWLAAIEGHAVFKQLILLLSYSTLFCFFSFTRAAIEWATIFQLKECMGALGYSSNSPTFTFSLLAPNLNLCAWRHIVDRLREKILWLARKRNYNYSSITCVCMCVCVSTRDAQARFMAKWSDPLGSHTNEAHPHPHNQESESVLSKIKWKQTLECGNNLEWWTSHII